MGFLGSVPRAAILNETIRNLYFHVPMWFAMIVLFIRSVYHAIGYLRTGDLLHDVYAKQASKAGVFFGTLGLLTGMLWAQYTWGAFWSGDPKQNSSAIVLLLYLAYFALRAALPQTETKAKLSAVYQVFAFPMMVVLLFILPRLTDSLHPGNGGNPAFNMYDLNQQMRPVFYAACLGWILLGVWLAQLGTRLALLQRSIYNSLP